MPRLSLLAIVALLVALGLAALVWRPGGEAELDAPRLDPGRPRELSLRPADQHSALFRVEVPPRATGLRLSTRGAPVDVAIFASRGQPPDLARERWDAASENLWIDDELLLERSDVDPLETGTWFVAFALSQPLAPAPAPERVRFLVEAALLEPAPFALVLDEPEFVVLSRARGLRALLTVELPPGAENETLRFEAFSPVADVDLVAGPADPARTLEEPYATSASLLPYERLELGPRERPAGVAVHVYAHSEVEGLDHIPVYVLAARGSRAVPTLVPTPEIPDGSGLTGVVRALAATAVVTGPLGSGSAVVVSPRGHVLTNAHCIAGTAGWPATDLALGFSVDPKLPAVPALALEIVEQSAALDLALLRIAGTLDGKAFDPPATLPWLACAWNQEQALGQELLGIGYPMTGGSGSLVTISLTRGVLSGYAREEAGWLIKTDAAIHAGVSGGACVDAHGRLIGLPSSSIADSNQAGGLGFVIPLERVPQSWRVEIEKR